MILSPKKSDADSRVKVGLLGLGAIGRLHYDCWRKSPVARLVAVSARDPRKLAGDWGEQTFNLGDQERQQIDLSDLRKYPEAEELFADSEVQIVDICLPTPLHAPMAIAALHAGKHVFLEKPMALDVEECLAIEAAARETGMQLMVGHCLRYWPHYVKAHQLLQSGEYGRAVYAQFHRSGAAPMWSSGGWLLKSAESGGVLDMHIHDIDVALWWFGRPEGITTSGYSVDGLPMVIDSQWQYQQGLTAQLHGRWDRNGGNFRHAFILVMERGTVTYDMATDSADALRLWHNGKEELLPIVDVSAHQGELDDFARAVASETPVERLLPEESRLAVELGLEELRQLAAR
jgi:predicted dehydrogenase